MKKESGRTRLPTLVTALTVIALGACATASGKDAAMPNEIATRPLVIAHRGFRAIAPENTLRALDEAHAAGSPWWELDVAASSDGVLVVIHDDTLSRTTDAERAFPGRKPWTVYDFTAGELKSLDAGSWYLSADPRRILPEKASPPCAKRSN